MASACVSLEPFALRVLDDAMAPDVPAGAVVIVDPGDPAEDGALVVLEHEGALLLRRLRLGPAGGGDAAARCVSPAAPEILLDGAWRRSLRGVVTAVRGPRRRSSATGPRGPSGSGSPREPPDGMRAR